MARGVIRIEARQREAFVYHFLCAWLLVASAGCREEPIGDVAVRPATPTAKQAVPPSTVRKEIDASEAVRLAERFIRDQGYTDFVPLDTAKLQPESFEITERQTWIESRKKSLLPKARGTLKGAMNAPKGWTVGFALVKPLTDPGVGLAVTMDEFGGNITMQHQGFNLKYLDTEVE